MEFAAFMFKVFAFAVACMVVAGGVIVSVGLAVSAFEYLT